MRKSAVVAAGMSVVLMVLAASPASATIHPIVQSIACAAAEAREHVAIADPPGQTPDGLVGENMSLDFPLLTISFPTPLTFDKSDFRALMATGFIDAVIRDANGDVTALVVDLTSLPKAISGSGGQHCANAG